MKPVKKTVTVLVAAALLLMACAFTVITGLDQRFVAYFRGAEEDAQQVSGGVVGVEESFQYENGWTVNIVQVLADRYSMAVLSEVVAPEGTVLDGEAYYLELGMELPPSARNQPASSGWGYGPVILEDEDPGDNRLTFLQTKGARELGAKDLLGQSVTLTPKWLMESGGKKLNVDFSREEQEQSCTVALPEQDSGRTYALSAPIQVDGETMTLSELYLSPISAAFVLQGEMEERAWEESDLARVEEDASLRLADGTEVSVRRMVSQTTDEATGAVHSIFQTDMILEPEDVTAITLLGQTFSLDGLTFTEG
ncbi:hypothetical protein DWX58_14020 [Pseudoflavonifractor sp. AF19-9AC]|uniref:hypothetical protein n=1 Tax=Pseudoflavonifractor sp. AF19-9AC TaxID=2292244 RepID=UPI000E552715|nr:hypothetical protein [Pseudoflavonifractor sp. AF19-9AC]RHR05649.1 hypothetical protein DWX58_14020 [Pseudoflavonifractor sp. AF19-9AC]